MRDAPWVIYGATGVTGRMVVEKALARGHRPILSARDPTLAEYARARGLESVTVTVDDHQALLRLAGRASIVLNAAGPYSITAGPWVDACLGAGASYVDINGEIDVLVATLARDREAQGVGISLLGGAGFGVAAGECLAAHAARRLPSATELYVGIHASNAYSSLGALRSALEVVSKGGAGMSGGRLVREPVARNSFDARIDGRALHFVSMPLAEAVAAGRTTGVPTVRAGMHVPRVGALMPLLAPFLPWLARRRIVNRVLSWIAGRRRGDGGPCRSWAWARAVDGTRSVSSLLELGEGYSFAADAMVRAAERLAAAPRPGAFTPGAAFGPDFVLEIEGVVRRDLEGEG
jgi:short subunit dehydrogenase-like uncharacterized protein